MIEVNLIGGFTHLHKKNGLYSMTDNRTPLNWKWVRNKKEHNGVTIFSDDKMCDLELIKSINSKYKIGLIMEPPNINNNVYNNLDQIINYIDFILINLNNLYTTHLEYKERNYCYGYTHYESYFISLRKYEAIKKCYNNCYIVFDFTHNTNNDNEFYYIKYDEDLFNSFEKDYGKNRLLIPSNLCKTTFINLMTEMIDIIPNRNLI